jgi:hypothetical protein
MTYENFDLQGIELITAWADRFPLRMNRLITAIEDFARDGSGLRLAPEAASAVEVFLAPPRPRRPPWSDSAALLLVDHRANTVEIIQVIHELADDGAGSALTTRARLLVGQRLQRS